MSEFEHLKEPDDYMCMHTIQQEQAYQLKRIADAMESKTLREELEPDSFTKICDIASRAIAKRKGLQAECGRYKKALEEIVADDGSHESYQDSSDVVYRLQSIALKALEASDDKA